MTPDDLAALLRWLYADEHGGRFLPVASRDLRINERNLRGMMQGGLAIPDTVAGVVLILAAAHARLRGWIERAPPLDSLPLSAATRGELARVAAALP